METWTWYMYIIELAGAKIYDNFIFTVTSSWYDEKIDLNQNSADSVQNFSKY